ncbi:MAG: molybdopterin-dependent oxidoreductase [Actinomycetota bacterium]
MSADLGAASGAAVPWPMADVVTRTTFCRICHAACPMEIDVEDGRRIVAVRGDRSDPLFEGYTCIKGRQLADQYHDPDRLRAPLRRTADRGFEVIASGEALDEIADQVAAIVDAHGPRAVASYTGTGAYQNSVGVPMAQAWHRGFGSPSIYTSLTIDQPAHRTSLARLGAWEAGWHNFTDADVSMAIGYNPLVSSYAAASGLQGTNPFVKLREAKERGLRLIVVDPRRSELAKQADVWLQVAPGEDPTLLAAMVRLVLDRGWHDATFCEAHIEPGHLDALGAAVGPFDLGYAADRCGLDAATIEAATEMFATAERGAAGTGTGPNMAPHGSLTETLTLTLNVLCGRVNRPGDTLESPYLSSPGDVRRAQVIPPSDPTPGAPHRVRSLAGLPDEMLTNALNEEILLPGDGQVRALIVSGGNPVQAFPDQVMTLEAMAALDLLVVIDHRMTATAELADYVIAPRGQLERADIPNVMDRRFPAPYTNYTDAVIDSGDDVLNEWEVFAGIAARNGTPIDLPGGRLPVERQLTDEPLTDHDVIDHVFGRARMPMSEWRTQRQVIHHDRRVRVVDADPDADGRFAVAPDDVVAELAEVRTEGAGAALLGGFEAERFPFRLVSRRLKHALNSLGSELPGLARVATTNHAHLHPDDLAELGVADGDLVEITSQRGRVVGVARPDPDIKRGVISMAHSWGGRSTTDERVREIGAPTNRLVDATDGTDRITGLPVMSAIPVRVRRTTDEEVGPGAR